MSDPAALEDRSADITRWVTECLDGLGVKAKPVSILNPFVMVEFFQPVAFTTEELHRSKDELRTLLMDRVVNAVREAADVLKTRDADPSWGFSVEVTKDIRKHPAWTVGTPHYACYLKWHGPRPRFWPLQMKCGVAENRLSVTPAGASVRMPSKRQAWFKENVAPRRKKHG